MIINNLKKKFSKIKKIIKLNCQDFVFLPTIVTTKGILIFKNTKLTCLHKQTPYSSLNFKIGYYVSLYGVAIILLWIGIFKFTPTEAAAIQPLVENHPPMSWLYNVLSVQGVSNLIGSVEILTAIAIVFAPYIHFSRVAASIGILVTFLATLAFFLPPQEHGKWWTES